MRLPWKAFNRPFFPSWNSDKAWPVFIHCQRGADRTGTVIACYRILTQGWTNAQAMKEAESLGLASFQTGKKHFILGWNPPPPGRSLDAQRSS